MSYFNQSFQKTILATGGLETTASKYLWDLNDLAAAGSPALPKVAMIGVNGKAKDTILTSFSTEQPFTIAGSTLRSKDKLGKFAGGYQSPNTSKMINPKYVSKLYVVLPQSASNATVSVGNVASDGTCADQYFCGTTYYLQLDVKGSKVASVLMHNYHQRIPAFVSCCGADDPTEALADNNAQIYLEWAKYINNDPTLDGIVKAFVAVDGDFYGDAIEGDATVGTVSGSLDELEATLAGTHDAITAAGLYIVAAYVDTKFGDCSFNKRDNVNLVPIEIGASHVDVEGNPCMNYCDIVATAGTQATRTGESLLRDEVILDESYHQRFVSDCARKREIEGSDAIFSAIDRNAQYPGVYIEHSIPRLSNPTGTFDNDRYLIQIIANGGTTQDKTDPDHPVTVLDGDIADIVDALEGLTGLTAEIHWK